MYDRGQYEVEQVYAGHSSYVSSVCVIPRDGTHSEGLVVTGSRDTTILMYPPRSAEPVHTLTGHSDTGQYFTQFCFIYSHMK